MTHFDWPPVSRRQVLLFHASACNELTPPICRTPPGPHAGSPLAEGTTRRAFLCPGTCDPPSFGVIKSLSTRQQWFTHVRLLVAYLTRSQRTVSATLTTPALDRRSLRWFGISACTATPEDLPPSLAQHGSCWRPSTSSSRSFQDTHRIRLSTSAAWSGSPVPETRPHRGRATMRRCSPATSWHSSPSTADSLGPFAMYVAFPRADYYGPPPRPGDISRRWACPPPPWLGGGEGDPGTAPTFTMHRSIGLAPSSAPAASPRVRRRPSPGASPPASESRLWSRRPGPYRVARTAARPISTRSGAGSTLEGAQPLAHLRHAFRSRLPGPGRLAVPASSRRCQGCSRPPLHLQDQAALSFTGLLRQPGEAGLSPPSGHMAPRGAPGRHEMGPCSGWRWCTLP